MTADYLHLFREKQEARAHARKAVEGERTGQPGSWHGWFDFINAFPLDSQDRAIIVATFCDELDSLDQAEHDPELADTW